LVVVELVKARLNNNLDPNLYYFRDNHQHEIDVIFKFGSKLVPIEIKASQTFNTDFLKELRYFEKLAFNRVSESYLIYAGDQERTIGNVHVKNFKHAHLIVEQEPCKK
jgi:predicted AAA+ superfamily ATPase